MTDICLPVYSIYLSDKLLRVVTVIQTRVCLVISSGLQQADFCKLMTIIVVSICVFGQAL